MTTETREALERYRSGRHEAGDAKNLAALASRIVAELEAWRENSVAEQNFDLAVKITAILEGK